MPACRSLIRLRDSASAVAYGSRSRTRLQTASANKRNTERHAQKLPHTPTFFGPVSVFFFGRKKEGGACGARKDARSDYRRKGSAHLPRAQTGTGSMSAPDRGTLPTDPFGAYNMCLFGVGSSSHSSLSSFFGPFGAAQIDLFSHVLVRDSKKKSRKEEDVSFTH
nr:hypothetical protein [Pandoravirus massiliensis]